MDISAIYGGFKETHQKKDNYSVKISTLPIIVVATFFSFYVQN